MSEDLVSASSPDMPAPLMLRLFGPLEAAVHGVPLPRLRSRTGYRLLALLVLRANGEVERDWLAGTLWPESSPSQGAGNLRETLRDLRRALGAEASRLASPTRRTLRLDLTGAAVDLTAFDALIARSDPASREALVSHYRAPFLEGWTDEWVFQERQAREEVYLRALESLAEGAVARGETAGAEGHLRRAVAVDPLRETAQRSLMQVLAGSGNYAAAVQVYRELRLRLHRELNAEPDGETQALFQQLRDEARARAAAGRANSRRPLPVASPVNSEAVRAPVDLPELATDVWRLAEPRHNLPHELTSFIGREDQMAELQQWLSISRLVTLTGAGGCGKSRLAREVGWCLLTPPAVVPEPVPGPAPIESCAHGVWLVELAPLADPALVPQSVATALGVREVSGQPLIQTLLAYLQPRPLLLLLDNCEHLIDACARLAESLLHGCPKLRILATSREPLGVIGERAYRVPSLSLPPLVDGRWSGTRGAGGVDGPAKTDPSPLSTINPPTSRVPELSAISQYEAIRLFCERAAAVVPTFALTAANAAAVAQVCRRLDGIPLAIELAAARLRSLSVESIASRLDQTFRLLTGGSRTALPRHQTLRASIDWSYHLLSEPEQTLLRRLSVFAGGWTLESAEAVCSEVEEEACPDLNARMPERLNQDDVLDLLTALVDKSLAMEEPGPEMRYRLLETVRQYSRERLLEAGEVSAAQERHCEWCLALAEEAKPELEGAHQQRWLERLEREHDNMRAALAWAVARGQGEVGLRLGGALWRFWLVRGYAREGREHLARLLAPLGAGAEGRTVSRAEALHGAAMLARNQGEYRAAQSLWEQSLAIFQERGNKPGIAWSLSGLGYYEEGLAIFRELGDKPGIAESLNILGWVARERGDYGTARTLHEEGLAIFRELGDRRGTAESLNCMGWMAQEQGDHGTAPALHKQSLAIFQELGDKGGIAWSLESLGCAAHGQGDHEAARSLWEESLAIFRELEEKPAIARLLGELATLAVAQGRYEEAQQIATQEEEGVQIHALGAVGHAARERGDYEWAAIFYRRSLALRRKRGDTYVIGQSLEDFAGLAARQQRWARAAALLGAAEAICAALGATSPLAPPEEYERAVREARAALGEEAFGAAWANGQAMSLADAVALALEE